MTIFVSPSHFPTVYFLTPSTYYMRQQIFLGQSQSQGDFRTEEYSYHFCCSTIKSHYNMLGSSEKFTLTFNFDS